MKYPNLLDSKIISFDTETKDSNLIKLGQGSLRKDGFVLGVSISNGEFSEYYNIGHKDCKLSERDHNIKYLKEVLESDIPKVGTNIPYDIEWLKEDLNINVNGYLNDISLAEPLLDEYARSFSLDSLAMKYLNEHKKNNELLDFCERNNLKTTARKGGREHIHLMSYQETRSYAIADVDQPLRIFKKQYIELTRQELLNIYDLECRLIRPLLLMRKNGVRLDLKKMDEIQNRLEKENLVYERELIDIAGKPFNNKSNKQLSEVFDSLGIPYERNEPTEKMREKGKIGNPKLDKRALKKIDHPIVNTILKERHNKTLISLFLEPYKDYLYEGRIYPKFNQLRSDNYGTVSGRLSGSQPNLQQVSTEEKESPENSIRKIFIPEEGCLWLKNDWSQIEYRIIAHYASGRGSEVIKSRYNNDPKTDYHNEIGDMVGIDDRKVMKNINFAVAYGMGAGGMSSAFGWDIEYAKNVLSLYNAKVPFVKELMNSVMKVSKNRGYIKTILGRRARLPSPDKAYIMLNRLIQGSAADIMKKAIVDTYEAGVFNSIKPHLTVHDELDCSMPLTPEGLQGAKELKRIMETCIKLDVPIISDAEIGNNWNDIQDFDEWREGFKL